MTSLRTERRSSFAFLSDIPPGDGSCRSGIIHATKCEEHPSERGSGPREEHAFAWLDDRRHRSADDIVGHMVQYGFEEGRMVFIPYSRKEKWLHRYPHACPYMECDSEGNIRGVPYFQQCINGDARTKTPTAISGPPPAQSKAAKHRQRQRKKAVAPKLVPNGELNDRERNQLHLEIYNYLKWLYAECQELETSESGRYKVARAGMSVPGLQNILKKFENTFKYVGEHKNREASDGSNDKGGGETGNGNAIDGNKNIEAGNTSEKENTSPAQLPMLERNLAEALRAAMPEEPDDNRKTEEPRDFEVLFASLIAFKEEKGHTRVPFKNGRLGKWVGDLRKRKRALKARGLECEPDDPKASGSKSVVNLQISPGRLGLTLGFHKVGQGLGAIITGISPECTFKDQVSVGDRLITIDDVAVTGIEDLNSGKDKEKRVFAISRDRLRMSSVFLSAERVERLDAINFQWEVQTTEPKTWDERLELLKRYKAERGRWPSKNEKWEGMGTWAHAQRRAWARKDKKFMETRAPILEEIGFPFSLIARCGAPVTYEDNFQQLVEFHRVNRHFDVGAPESEETEEDKAAGRFYRWVKILRTSAYRDYKNGKPSVLNEDRVNQLLQMGFTFTEPAPRKALQQQIEVPFERRLEQMKSVQDLLMGHLDIDFRYTKRDNLGSWCAHISKRYTDWQEGKETITPEEEYQFNQLRELGFEFNIIPQARDRRSWKENFEAFLKFQKRHGHSDVPRTYIGDVRMSTWVTLQRDYYKALREGKKSQLTQERIDKLNDAGFIWETKGDGDDLQE